MRRSLVTFALILLAVIAACEQRATAAPANADIGFCKPYTWLFGGWVAPPRIPLLGDINGDGYVDFLYASPQDKSIDVSLNGRGWKPVRGRRLVSDLPEEIRAISVGHLGGKTLDLAILGKDGGLLKAVSDEQGTYHLSSTLCKVNTATGKVWLLAGKIFSPKQPPRVSLYREHRSASTNCVPEGQVAEGRTAKEFFPSHASQVRNDLVPPPGP